MIDIDLLLRCPLLHHHWHCLTFACTNSISNCCLTLLAGRYIEYPNPRPLAVINLIHFKSINLSSRDSTSFQPGYKTITMGVPQLVHLFESLHHHSHHRTSQQEISLSSSRLQLYTHTMPSDSQRSRSRGHCGTSSVDSMTLSTSSYTDHTATAATYEAPRTPPMRPITLIDPFTIFTPISASTSPSSSIRSRSSVRNHIRRQPSSIDIILESERYCTGPESLGLGLLEPRPKSSTSVFGAEVGRCSWSELLFESPRPQQTLEVWFDGIEAVLEGH